MVSSVPKLLEENYPSFKKNTPKRPEPVECL